ncbi:syncollin-like [Bombina bombina]|uniref:syncollin-like n=1 Tax=Bombina bombina TaxID=8345 RepID=UPI00235A69FB|nr:syncollin-like [Bombina bombina]
MRSLSLFFPLLLVSLSWGLCPQPADLKDTYGNKICARLFEDSSVYYDECCGGSYLDVVPGADVPYIPLGWNNRISSLVIAPRCELTVWSRKPKEGSTKKFTSGVQARLSEVKKGLFGDWNDSISSYYCKCNA